MIRKNSVEHRKRTYTEFKLSICESLVNYSVLSTRQLPTATPIHNDLPASIATTSMFRECPDHYLVKFTGSPAHAHAKKAVKKFAHWVGPHPARPEKKTNPVTREHAPITFFGLTTVTYFFPK